jgi:hypothetical protein
MTRQKVGICVFFGENLDAHHSDTGGAYPHPDGRVRDHLRNCSKTQNTKATPSYAAFLVALFKEVALIITSWSHQGSETSLAKAWRDYLGQETRNGRSERDDLYGLAIEKSKTESQEMLAEAKISQASLPMQMVPCETDILLL